MMSSAGWKDSVTEGSACIPTRRRTSPPTESTHCLLSDSARQRHKDAQADGRRLNTEDGRDRASDHVREERDVALDVEPALGEADELVGRERDDPPSRQERKQAARSDLQQT